MLYFTHKIYVQPEFLFLAEISNNKEIIKNRDKYCKVFYNKPNNFITFLILKVYEKVLCLKTVLLGYGSGSTNNETDRYNCLKKYSFITKKSCN
jgi:hypothetical protein